MAEEVTREEYRRYERKRDQYQRDVDRYEKQVRNLDEDIRRLTKARDQMAACDSSFKSEVKGLDKYLTGKFTFKGNNKDTIIDTYGGNVIYAAEYSRDHIVNKALDDLEWLLTKKKNERDEANGLWGKAKSALRSAWTWLNTHWWNN